MERSTSMTLLTSSRKEKDLDEKDNSSQRKEEYLDGRDNSSYLCEDMLNLIISRLFLDDVKNFNRVCKLWSHIQPPRILSPENFPTPGQTQWLMCIEGGRAKLFHPLSKEPYVMKNVLPHGSTIRFSNNGWLLMSSRPYGSKYSSVFFLNPFTGNIINLPNMDVCCMSMMFTCSPTSNDCMVIGIYWFYSGFYSICTILHGEKDWQHSTGFFERGENLPQVFCNQNGEDGEDGDELDPDLIFDYQYLDIDNQDGEEVNDQENDILHLSNVNPVLHNGKFYLLGEDGRLVVLTRWKKRKNDTMTWKVFEVFGTPPPIKGAESFLVGCDKTLFLVFLVITRGRVAIFKLNDATMTWDTVDSLGENMFFLGLRTSSFSRRKAIEGMQNRIYFPLIYKNRVVSYSLDKGHFQTIGYSSTDVAGTGKPIISCWIETDTCSDQDPNLDWLAL